LDSTVIHRDKACLPFYLASGLSYNHKIIENIASNPTQEIVSVDGSGQLIVENMEELTRVLEMKEPSLKLTISPKIHPVKQFVTGGGETERRERGGGGKEEEKLHFDQNNSFGAAATAKWPANHQNKENNNERGGNNNEMNRQAQPKSIRSASPGHQEQQQEQPPHSDPAPVSKEKARPVSWTVDLPAKDINRSNDEQGEESKFSAAQNIPAHIRRRMEEAAQLKEKEREEQQYHQMMMKEQQLQKEKDSHIPLSARSRSNPRSAHREPTIEIFEPTEDHSHRPVSQPASSSSSAHRKTPSNQQGHPPATAGSNFQIQQQHSAANVFQEEKRTHSQQQQQQPSPIKKVPSYHASPVKHQPSSSSAAAAGNSSPYPLAYSKHALFHVDCPLRCSSLLKNYGPSSASSSSSSSSDSPRTFVAVGTNMKNLHILSYKRKEMQQDLRENRSGAGQLIDSSRLVHVEKNFENCHKGSVYCLDWSPATRLLASGSNDKLLKIWR
jgi:chemotaxis protein histidine kinase CheA